MYVGEERRFTVESTARDLDFRADDSIGHGHSCASYKNGHEQSSMSEEVVAITLKVF